MPTNQFLQNVAYSIIITIGLGWLLFIGSSVVQPFFFATFFAIFIYPIDRFILKRVHLKWLSITLSYLTILIPVLIVFGLFYMQVSTIIESLPSIGTSIQEGIDQISSKIKNWVPFLNLNSKDLFSGDSSPSLEGPLSFIRKSIVSTTSILTATVLTFIYSFFILYYRTSFKNFIVYQFEKNSRPDIKETLTEIKETVQSYIGGIGIVTLILTTFNSLGLWLIGIDYPLFWGALGGLLCIVPYVGTLIGGMLPFLYALTTTDQSWQPIAIVLYYGVIQQIEGNFITPNIIGDKVNINPLVAILSLIFFGSFWGVGGMLLGLPIVSIIRIVLSQFESTKAIALLMSANIYKNAEEFKKIADS